mmetsp:Transcript_38267/g.70210  ORF Transcript_38267/g.70210 Transcript_38267/m.70210 type:complete len:91 (-) Transcript_38267:1125-1397(-)
MHLPPEVDVKKRGQNAYPCLEKLNAYSDTKNNPQAEAASSQPNAIPTTSSIYKLFDKHLGALTDNHGNQYAPHSLQSSLLTTIQHAASLH